MNNTATAEEQSDIKVLSNENYDKYMNVSKTVDPDQAAKDELVKVEAEKAERLKDDELKKKSEDEPGSMLGDKASDEDKHSLNARFKAQTDKRKEAEAKAAAAEERALKAAQEAAELRAKYEPVKEDLGPEPEPEQFTDTKEYSKALKSWTAENTKRTLLKEQETERTKKAWNDRISKVREKMPDFDETIASAQNVMVSPEMTEEIHASEVGPELLAYFAKNPDEATRLGKMTVGRMIKEIGKLEAAKPWETKETKTAQSKPELVEVEISKAPAPITPLKGGHATSGVLHGSDDVPKDMSFDEWERKFEAGKIK